MNTVSCSLFLYLSNGVYFQETYVTYVQSHTYIYNQLLQLQTPSETAWFEVVVVFASKHCSSEAIFWYLEHKGTETCSCHGASFAAVIGCWPMAPWTNMGELPHSWTHSIGLVGAGILFTVYLQRTRTLKIHPKMVKVCKHIQFMGQNTISMGAWRA